MGRGTFELPELAALTASIAHYNNHLINAIMYPRGDNSALTDWLNKRASLASTQHDLERFDIHCVRQMWSSTSGGWGGMGGNAMTIDFTTVIYPKGLDIIAVYYNGEIAYVMDLLQNPKFQLLMTDFTTTPAYYNVIREASGILYFNKRGL